MIKKLIVKNRSYKNKKGEEKIDKQFFLVLENGNRVRISPYFCTIQGKEWNTFSDLLLIAETEKDNGKE